MVRVAQVVVSHLLASFEGRDDVPPYAAVHVVSVGSVRHVFSVVWSDFRVAWSDFKVAWSDLMVAWTHSILDILESMFYIEVDSL